MRLNGAASKRVMPKITIRNNTQVAGSTLPNGVKLKITVGNTPQRDLAVGESRTYNVNVNQVIKIKPEATFMTGANYQQEDNADKTLSIVPADDLEVHGVQVEILDD
jgi:hypothetical protein